MCIQIDILCLAQCMYTNCVHKPREILDTKYIECIGENMQQHILHCSTAAVWVVSEYLMEYCAHVAHFTALFQPYFSAVSFVFVSKTRVNLLIKN